MSNHQELMAFVWEKAELESIPKRIKIYKGMAELCGNEAEERHLTELVRILEESDRLCREFEFSFVKKPAVK